MSCQFRTHLANVGCLLCFLCLARHCLARYFWTNWSSVFLHHYWTLHLNRTTTFWFCSPVHCTCVLYISIGRTRVINFKLVCSLTRNITSHSMKNLAFHSLLRWNMAWFTTNSHYLAYTFIFKMYFWTREWKSWACQLISIWVKSLVQIPFKLLCILCQMLLPYCIALQSDTLL